MSDHIPPTSCPRFHLAFLPGEQATMVVLVAFGNALEVNGFHDIDRLFAKRP